MRELIIKVDDPSERAWDGSSKVFETKELVRCKDCKHFDGLNCKVNDITNIMDTNWFCADGEKAVSE